MARTRVRYGRIAGVAAAALVAANLVAQAAGGEPRSRPEPAHAPAHAPVHAVRPGDTLWEIARRLVGPEGDPRPMVADLRELNGLGTDPLATGTRLLLPPA